MTKKAFFNSLLDAYKALLGFCGAYALPLEEVLKDEVLLYAIDQILPLKFLGRVP